MFATRAQPAASVLSAGIQTRNMATLKEIQLRLNSIKNIGKITKSMKMIASTKVTKAQRAMETARAYGATSSSQSASGVIVLGDKAKNQMSRSNRGDIQLSFSQIGKAIPTFAEASAAADTILQSGVKFDNATIVYNEFVSAIAYEAVPLRNYSSDALKASEGFAAYELDEDVLANYNEF
ncbi:atp3 gamma subunit of the F1 sector of mitochondrial F1F0 ATP synthase, partial [Mortierella sp. GBA30]